jgi:hypothetical protein
MPRIEGEGGTSFSPLRICCSEKGEFVEADLDIAAAGEAEAFRSAVFSWEE